MTHPDSPVGPAVSDRELAAWRDAVSHAGLPVPTRTRWQASRAGLVNLWEFDVSEYWFADGRAQFVGANQSGKSTLMALTTLTMLAGALDRQYIDTFGQSDKSFRYYVEPTDDPRDRRETTAQTNRGWAWVEFARLGEGGEPEYFTALLYAQAKRGVSHMPPTWIICRGKARVRDGIDLAVGRAAVEPRDLHGIDGLTVMDSGRRYADRIATELFGFTDTDRYATVLEMLKTLRTPHLGQRLDPDWFTAQIRAALPPVARTEVEELAAGWQQLEQLSHDRNDAEAARDAVALYLGKSWRPWVDALLRARADALLDADAAVTAAEDAVCSADAALDQAQDDLRVETDRTEVLEEQARHAQAALTQLLRSDAYRDADGRTRNAERLRREAEDAERQRDTAGQRLDRLRADHDRAESLHREATGQLGQARTAVDQAAGHAAAAVVAAGLGDEAPQWVAARDVDRIDAAVTDRRSRIGALRRLLRETGDKDAAWRNADRFAEQARTEWQSRVAAARAAQTRMSDALQEVSDRIERWAAELHDDAPDAGLRDRWVQDVTAQSSAARPRPVLRTLVARQWLDPTVVPLTETVAELRAAAGIAEQRAAEADQEATRLEQAGDPQPPAPYGWTRRERPAFPGPDGAPLWRLLDPVDGLGADVLATVEAALTAAGLLHAWVTSDGMWAAGRDGDDTVLSAFTAVRDETDGTAFTAGRPGADPTAFAGGRAGADSTTAVTGSTLAAVLQPAEDAGSLTGMVTGLLARIGYSAVGAALTGESSVAADGRWRMTGLAGRAARAEHGAELIGTAARTHARRRRIDALRQEALRQRQEAATRLAEAAAVNTRVARLRNSADTCPDDTAVVTAANGHHTAVAERDRAHLAHAQAQDDAAKAKRAADEATAAAAWYAAEQRLPAAGARLVAVGTAVDKAARAGTDLRLALRELDTATRAVAGTAAGVDAAAAAVDEADEAGREAAETAARLRIEAAEAADSIDRDDRAQLDRAAQLEKDISDAAGAASGSRRRGLRLAADASTARNLTETRRRAAAAAVAHRDAAVADWWVPVDAGLATARDLPEPAGRGLAAALAQAHVAVAALRPPGWPDTAEEKARRVAAAQHRAFTNPRFELQAKLEASGGRSVIAVDADDVTPLPAIMLVVDASGTQLTPPAAVEHLLELVTQLSASHDEKLHQMYTELLSSTFINHLADRMTRVVDLLKAVNTVLDRHPTGVNKTKLRLIRRPAEGQRHGYHILEALEKGTIDSADSQEQMRLFLADRLREAQESGLVGTDDWVEHLSRLLDYRAWFDIVPEFRIGDSKWRPLTRQVHSVDSGGGKVVTLLQPLLATLVTLFAESPDAPRPLWLDEAFTGVDTPNRSTMLRMMVDFDFDFLLAGPSALVTAAQVPAAAIWTVSRAPAPVPGVDLSLMLWTGQAIEYVPVGDIATATLTPPRPADDTPDLFSSVDDPGTPSGDPR
ncbi:SbcC/MukB-like Walker B domain-containing protein [Actinoplanes utahensis]|uniref:SbcC/MukB-like Walker B domain-containing protein n=1 Tax=Actinoplanes utahensis TaxID=1869 RepID=UPI0031EB5566